MLQIGEWKAAVRCVPIRIEARNVTIDAIFAFHLPKWRSMRLLNGRAIERAAEPSKSLASWCSRLKSEICPSSHSIGLCQEESGTRTCLVSIWNDSKRIVLAEVPVFCRNNRLWVIRYRKPGDGNFMCKSEQNMKAPEETAQDGVFLAQDEKQIAHDHSEIRALRHSSLISSEDDLVDQMTVSKSLLWTCPSDIRSVLMHALLKNRMMRNALTIAIWDIWVRRIPFQTKTLRSGRDATQRGNSSNQNHNFWYNSLNEHGKYFSSTERVWWSPSDRFWVTIWTDPEILHKSM